MSPTLFALIILERALSLSLGQLRLKFSYCKLPMVAGMTNIYHHTQLSLGRGVLRNFYCLNGMEP
jgi:hypothetical protein